MAGHDCDLCGMEESADYCTTDMEDWRLPDLHLCGECYRDYEAQRRRLVRRKSEDGRHGRMEDQVREVGAG